MVREIITLFAGQCGVQIANSFWEQIAVEHEISLDGISYAENDESHAPTIMFKEKLDGSYTPRCCLFDTDPIPIESTRSGRLKNLLDPEYSVMGKEGGANCYAYGRYVTGKTIVVDVIRKVRNLLEQCNSCCNMTHVCSTNGGTGAGMMTDVISTRAEHKHFDTHSYKVYPSPTMGTMPCHYYNTILHMNSMSDLCDANIVIDNETLYHEAEQLIKNRKDDITFADINAHISLILSGCTQQNRYPGGADLKHLITNLIPFAGADYLHVYLAGCNEKFEYGSELSHIAPLTNHLFDGNSASCVMNLDEGEYMCAAILYRGENISPRDIFECLYKVKADKRLKFASWAPCPTKSSLIQIKPVIAPTSRFQLNSMSVVKVANHTSMKSVIQRYLTNFDALYKKKSFVHWYKDMEDQQFLEARHQIELVQKVYESTVSYQ